MTTETAAPPVRQERFRGIRVLEVIRTERLTPRMQRLVLGGPEMEGFGSGPNLKLLIPPRGIGTPHWPRPDANGRPIWPPAELRPAVRTYSLRRHDVARGEIHVDFVLHGAGVASAFAENARPGDVVGVGGPGGRTLPAADFRLLAGDHSALPSIAALLEAMPEDARGAAFIAVADRGEEQDLAHPKGVRLTWLHQGAHPAGPSPLIAAVEACRWPDEDRVSAWVAAESDTARTLRAHLRDTRGLDRRALVAVGYWKRGMSETAYHDAHDHDRDEDYHRASREEDAAR